MSQPTNICLACKQPMEGKPAADGKPSHGVHLTAACQKAYAIMTSGGEANVPDWWKQELTEQYGVTWS